MSLEESSPYDNEEEEKKKKKDKKKKKKEKKKKKHKRRKSKLPKESESDEVYKEKKKHKRKKSKTQDNFDEDSEKKKEKKKKKKKEKKEKEQEKVQQVQDERLNFDIPEIQYPDGKPLSSEEKNIRDEIEQVLKEFQNIKTDTSISQEELELMNHIKMLEKEIEKTEKNGMKWNNLEKEKKKASKTIKELEDEMKILEGHAPVLPEVKSVLNEQFDYLKQIYAVDVNIAKLWGKTPPPQPTKPSLYPPSKESVKPVRKNAPKRPAPVKPSPIKPPKPLKPVKRKIVAPPVKMEKPKTYPVKPKPKPKIKKEIEVKRQVGIDIENEMIKCRKVKKNSRSRRRKSKVNLDDFEMLGNDNEKVWT